MARRMCRVSETTWPESEAVEGDWARAEQVRTTPAIVWRHLKASPVGFCGSGKPNKDLWQCELTDAPSLAQSQHDIIDSTAVRFDLMALYWCFHDARMAAAAADGRMDSVPNGHLCAVPGGHSCADSGEGKQQQAGADQ